MDCVSCGNSSPTIYSKDSYMDLPVYQCPDCDLLMTGNSEIEIKRKSESIYKKEYWDARESEKSLNANYDDPISRSKRRQWISQYLYCSPYLQSKKDFLEIGSGAGQTLFWFEEIGFNVLGIEPDERNVSLINQKLKRGKCIAGFIDEIVLQEEFDVIWISHVFEHLVRPDLLIKRYHEILGLDGIMFIEVPNCENDVIRESSIHENPSTFHFSKKALLRIAQNAGFKVELCDFVRAPKRVEGGLNKIKKILTNQNLYRYYPKIIANNKTGTDIRIILRK